MNAFIFIAGMFFALSALTHLWQLGSGESGESPHTIALAVVLEVLLAGWAAHLVASAVK